MGSFDDVRMRGFLRRHRVGEVLALIEERVAPLAAERVSVAEALDRVLAEEVRSPVDVPPFRRSAKDGYAVRAEETAGASPYSPAVLEVVGKALAGSGIPPPIGQGQALRIMTGGALPEGADAVVMAEEAAAEGREVRILAAVAPGEEVIGVGEDVRQGATALRAGALLRPQDLGLLVSIQVEAVPVRRVPSLAIFPTGSELVPRGARPSGTQIIESNSTVLTALAARHGARGVPKPILADDPAALRSALAAAEEDLIAICGGSSVGEEDFAPGVVAELGELPVHGVSMRPGSPAGLGFVAGRPLLLLPGHPVSSMVVFDLFGGAILRRMRGLPPGSPYRSARGRLTRKVASQPGRTDFVRVAFRDGAVEPLCLGGSSNLSTVTTADGLLVVREELEGLAEGEEVEVLLYACGG